MEAERQYLEYALTKSGGNKTLAAHMAGVSLTTLRDKLSRFTVKVEVSLE
ncbi:helix-turn-helix domain-containing protein [Ruegeria atlantica]